MGSRSGPALLFLGQAWSSRGEMPLSSLLRRAVASRGCVSSWCWFSSDLAQAGGVAAASGEGSGAEALCGCGIYIVSAVAARNELRSTVASVDTPRSKF
ncbi:hypothetical protein PR002_g17730 [Phytophthora rubi]|uniref:Uncharacterized protein n=1 Tax=Phytophthora rubi TaxID=129364 RepID=A0A6A3KDT7_9STRA|nr:hypothetical protein PR002_g17730 [Phytophthora rubi]